MRGAKNIPKVVRQGLRLAFLPPGLTKAALDGEATFELKRIPKLLPWHGEGSTYLLAEFGYRMLCNSVKLKVTAAPSFKYKTALSVAYGAGLRASEVLALKVSVQKADLLWSLRKIIKHFCLMFAGAAVLLH